MAPPNKARRANIMRQSRLVSTLHVTDPPQFYRATACKAAHGNTEGAKN